MFRWQDTIRARRDLSATELVGRERTKDGQRNCVFTHKSTGGPPTLIQHPSKLSSCGTAVRSRHPMRLMCQRSQR